MPTGIVTVAALRGPSAPAIGEDVRDERRIEPRISADSIPATIRLETVSMPGQILNISTSGVRIRVDIELAIGQEVTLFFDHTIAVGTVRNCRAEYSNGRFQAGLQLEEVLNLA